MKPVVTFLREAWKKWEQKRSRKRNVPASTFNYVPSPRRSRAWSHQCASNTPGRTALPTDQNSFEDYTKSALASHKWITIKRRNSSATVKGRTSSRGGQVTSLCRESQPVSPLSCFTIPPGSKFPSRSEQDDRASDFHPRRGRNSSHSSAHPELHLPAIEKNYGRDDEFNSSSFKSVRSSLSSQIPPDIPLLNIVENPSTDPRVIVRGQTARITSRGARLLAPLVEPPEASRTRHPNDRVHLAMTKSSTSPKVYDSHTLVPSPDIIIQNSDIHNFPLSLFPRPPPLPVRKKVPKPLVLRPSSSSSSRGLLPYSPLLGTPTPRRPGSLRSISQTSISSSTKRAFGRPLTSVSPPPTSPPNTPLPIPPVDKRTDSDFLSLSSIEASIRSCETPTQQIYRRSADYPVDNISTLGVPILPAVHIPKCKSTVAIRTFCLVSDNVALE